VKRLAALLLLSLALTLQVGGARAERIVSTLSNPNVEITSGFAGERLTLFGNIEPDAGAADQTVTGPYHIIVVITGPLTDRVARLKTRQLGVWLNTQQVVFNSFPSYFHVMASDKLEDITDMVTLNVEGILPEAQAQNSAPEGDWWNAAVFGRELVRLMTEKGFFGVNTSGVSFLSETAYSAQLILPHDVPNGPFIAQTYLFKEGKLLAKRSEGFSVRKIGFERFVGTTATQYPLFYGLVCVLLAVFTGWLGGVVFKR
jgi:uncharacterized protein (TIGR02186 family)